MSVAPLLGNINYNNFKFYKLYSATPHTKSWTCGAVLLILSTSEQHQQNHDIQPKPKTMGSVISVKLATAYYFMPKQLTFVTSKPSPPPPNIHTHTHKELKFYIKLKCCFTSTETVGLLGAEAQDGHLDFHTAPELLSSTQTGPRGQKRIWSSSMGVVSESCVKMYPTICLASKKI